MREAGTGAGWRRDRRLLVLAAGLALVGAAGTYRILRPAPAPGPVVAAPTCAQGTVAVEWPAGGRKVGCVEAILDLVAEAAQAAGCTAPEKPVPAAPGDRLVIAPGDGACTVRRASLSGHERLALGIPIDLNRADATDLAALRGIGPVRAAAIVADREARGAFPSVADLARVRGIGPVTVERIAPFVVAGEAAGQRTTVP